MSGLWISVEPCLDPMIVYMLTLDIPAQKQPSSFVWLGQGKSHGIQMSLSTIGKLSSVARGFTGGRKPPRNYPIHGLAILTHSTSTLGSKVWHLHTHLITYVEHARECSWLHEVWGGGVVHLCFDLRVSLRCTPPPSLIGSRRPRRSPQVGLFRISAWVQDP